MFFTRKNNFRLTGNTLAESQTNVQNPDRGWYRIYSYALGGEAGWIPPVLYEGETLALVMINIGAYREKAIAAEGLAELRQILSSFVNLGVDIILRAVYDTQGKGMEREPSLFSQVLEHIGQIGTILPEYADYILLFQGLLVGSWGEMHSSKFLSGKYLREMAEKFFEATEGKIRLAFRTPALLRKAAKEGEKLCGSIGFFDDALLADGTHMGTFGTLPKAEAGWEQAWCPEEERAFMEEATYRIPFGGEAVAGAGEPSAEAVIAQLERFHVSYLNCTHDRVCLERWKRMSVGAVSLYDYVGAHLGYRYVVERAAIIRKGKEYFLQAEIANRGFACCPAELTLSLYAGEREAAAVVLQPEELSGGQQGVYGFPLNEELLEEGMPLSLGLRTRAGGNVIVFANEGADRRLFLGTPVRGGDDQ